jgi:hypothetical protein
MQLSKLFLTTVIVLISFLLLAGFQTVAAQAPSNFPFKDVIGCIQPNCPADNASYTGEICLNMSIQFSVQSTANSSLIPYQNIQCIYQLDNKSWQNATLISASPQTAWYDPTFQGYWNQMRCNYIAPLPTLANGWHSLNVSLTPNLQYYCRVLSNGSYVTTLIGNQMYDALANSTINFYVYGNYDNPTPKSTSQSQPESSLVAIAIVSAASAITAGLFFHSKKHKQ